MPRVTEIDGSQAKAWFQRFVIHYQRGEFEEVKECAATAFAIDSKWLDFIEDAMEPKPAKSQRPPAKRTPLVVEQQRRRQQGTQPPTESALYRGAMSTATSDFQGMGLQKVVHPLTGEEWVIERSRSSTTIHSYKSPRGMISDKRYGPKEGRLLVAILETARVRFPEKEARLREMREKLSGKK